MERMYQTYKDIAEFRLVYITEAHASDGRRPVEYAREKGITLADDYAERCTTADMLLADESLTIPFVIDRMDDLVNQAYQAHPDRVFVVRTDGRLAVAADRGPRGFAPALRETDQWLTALRESGSDPALPDEAARAGDEIDAQAGTLPRVLLLGDSISMGYHKTVVAALEGQALVVRPQENCAGTTKGLRKLSEWLRVEGGNFDAIHFNFGLHDLKRVPRPGSEGGSNNPDDPYQADLETYEHNLREIVDRLKATGAELIFATTTPVPPGGVRPHRDVEDVPRYNAVARKIMTEHGITIDDLYAFALPKLDAIQQPVNVHFTPEGSAMLGEEVVGSVRAVLKLEAESTSRRGRDRE